MTDFITTWETTGADETITLPLVSGGTYNFVVDWGDGSDDDTITAWDQAEKTHTYTDADTYTVTITGTITGWAFNNAGDKTKIKEVAQWGSLAFGAGTLSVGAFYGCSALIVSALDAPDLTGTTSLYRYFRSCTSLVSGFSAWAPYVGNITTLYQTFHSDSALNCDFSTWGPYVGNVTDLTETYYGCTTQNCDFSTWGPYVGKVTTLSGTWQQNSLLNCDFSTWGPYVGKVTTLYCAWASCPVLNCNFDTWGAYVGKVTSIQSTWISNTALKTKLSSWILTACTNMTACLQGVTLPTRYYSDFLRCIRNLFKTGLTFHGGGSKYYRGWPTWIRAGFVAQGNTITADGGQEGVISSGMAMMGHC